MANSIDVDNLQRWLEKSAGLTDAKIGQGTRDSTTLAVGNIFRLLNDKGGAQVLQDLNVADLDGSKAEQLDRALEQAKEVARKHEQLNVASQSMLRCDTLQRGITFTDARVYVDEHADRTYGVPHLQKTEAQHALEVDRTIAHLRCRTALADVLRPRITSMEEVIIDAGGEAGFILCRDRYKECPLRNTDFEEALELCAEDPEYKEIFIELFLANAVVEDPKTASQE
ncbi:MAG: hypothetical protein Greene041662_682 [Candidatus Peregrinibacteria bacterium Greene0416_62]|nr:MAG: hypothetical protein Greene041662_682 [Candidatus Peregrinibacteria bacterium Greene0416_62]TSC96778.1 MAG: hypothetical protein Greene101449_1380 [Candidatus Peregrinibacteria bacterium Greene1014_49]